MTAGAAPGSIIAAIIDTHRATKNWNEPSRVATPMSIPFICRTATTQEAAASPSVDVSADAVAPTLTLVTVRRSRARLRRGTSPEVWVHIGGIAVADRLGSRRAA